MIVIGVVALTVCHPGYCFEQLSNGNRKPISTTSSGASIECRGRSEKVLPGTGIAPVPAGG